MSLQQRYSEICENVQRACDACGRSFDEVEIIAVTKTRSVQEINEAVALGIKTIGENRVQELLEKYEGLVLVEVNIGKEPTKSGVLPDKLSEYLDSLQNFRYIKPVGLMTVAPAQASELALEQYFAQMYQLLEQGKERFGNEFTQLSMGMSHDYEAAVRQGATMIRIGTALFGQRNYNI